MERIFHCSQLFKGIFIHSCTCSVPGTVVGSGVRDAKDDKALSWEPFRGSQATYREPKQVGRRKNEFVKVSIDLGINPEPETVPSAPLPQDRVDTPQNLYTCKSVSALTPRPTNVQHRGKTLKQNKKPNLFPSSSSTL